jgi:hypothetical protein
MSIVTVFVTSSKEAMSAATSERRFDKGLTIATLKAKPFARPPTHTHAHTHARTPTRTHTHTRASTHARLHHTAPHTPLPALTPPCVHVPLRTSCRRSWGRTRP